VDFNHHPHKRAMVAALAQTGNVCAASRCANVHRQRHYEWMKKDEVYWTAVADAMREAGELLEAEAWRRAMVGDLVPVYQRGEKMGTVRKYSDPLLIFLLKAAKPEKYRERVSHHTPPEPAGNPLPVSLSSLLSSVYSTKADT